LERLPHSAKLSKVWVEDLPAQVSTVAADSFVLLMTMGHTSDKPILMEFLKRWQDNHYPYIGVIGSNAKAARLKREVLEEGFPSSYCDLFYCPVGLDIGCNQPAEIAVSIAAQLLQVRDERMRTAATATTGELT
jgi:xanthine dehydrogenase accessory factor